MQKIQPDYNEEEQELAHLLGPRQAQCPPLDVLQALGQDVLPPAVEVAAATHRDRCPTCQMLLSDMAEIELRALTSAESQRIASSLPLITPRRSHVHPLIAVAALILCAVAITLFLRTRTAAPMDAEIKTPAAPAIVAKAEIPPIVPAPLAPPTETSLATRGAASQEPSTELLLPAFRYYNAGDYKHAAASFASLRASFPHSNLLPLYLGVSQLMLQQDAQAMASLNTVDSHSRYGDAAEWYNAIAASRLHAVGTENALHQICERKRSPFSGQACAALASTRQ